MEFRQLTYFVAVAEELHFGRAAKRVHIAQPPLSQQIKKLEEEIGVVLLKRTSRSVSLTPAGEVFLAEARAILRRADTAVERVAACMRGERGRLRIGFVGPAMEGALPGLIRTYRAAYPKVSLDLAQMGTLDQYDGVRTGKIDVGFMRLYGHDTTGLATLLFMREPYILAVPLDHPLAARVSARLGDLKGEPMIFAPRKIQPSLYDTFISLLNQAGVVPDIVQEAVGKRTTVALVASGLGVSLVPASMAMSGAMNGAMSGAMGGAMTDATDRARDVAGNVRFLPLVDSPLPPVEISLVWNAGDDSPVLARFTEMARERFQP